MPNQPSTNSSNRRDFLPTASLATLRLRARLLNAVRRFFDSHGFWEVETPLLSHDIVVDAYLEPFDTLPAAGSADPPGTGRLYLQTSPEFGMKRLLAAGADAIYQIGKVFRRDESGRHHNPEFTMIEWYRVGWTHHDQMDFVEQFVTDFFQETAQASPVERTILSAESKGESSVGRTILSAETDDDGQDCPSYSLPSPVSRLTFERLSYEAAFQQYAGTGVLTLSAAELRDLAQARGIVSPPGLDAADRDGWLNLLLVELVEPHLGRQRPTFLYDYPASQAALARVVSPVGSPPVAERFELYLDGGELCNGYHELTDPQELRRRMQVQAAIRESEGRPRLPQHNRLLDAMEAGLPPCAGVALGFDRLLMQALGAQSIAEVMAFPFDRA